MALGLNHRTTNNTLDGLRVLRPQFVLVHYRRNQAGEVEIPPRAHGDIVVESSLVVPGGDLLLLLER